MKPKYLIGAFIIFMCSNEIRSFEDDNDDNGYDDYEDDYFDDSVVQETTSEAAYTSTFAGGFTVFIKKKSKIVINSHYFIKISASADDIV